MPTLYNAPIASFFGNVITVATMTSLFSSILLAPFFSVGFVYFLYVWPALALSIIILIISTLWIARAPWLAFGNNAIFRQWRSYFSFSIVKEAPLAAKGSLIAVFPHGVFPLGLLLCAGCQNEVFPEHSPTAKKTTLIASVFFSIPILAPILTWLGCVSATHANTRSALASGTALLLPEGIAGVFLTSRKQELVYLSRRRGFIRLALETGSDFVPAYVFGQSHLLDVLPGAGSYLEALSRRLRVSLMLYFGRFYFPLPRAIPLTVVIGSPIRCTKSATPSEEDIEHLHSVFCKELVALFDRHKHLTGWGEKKLEIV